MNPHSRLHQLSSEEWNSYYGSLPAVFNPLKSSTNHENQLQSSQYKNMDNFPLQKEAIMCNHQIDTLHCQQRWQKMPLVSPENALYLLWYAKRHLLGWNDSSNSEKNKACTLSHCQVMLVWRYIRQLVSQ